MEEDVEDDQMDEFMWDGPDDSDEEISDMMQYKNSFEKSAGIKYSKNGLISYIEKMQNDKP